MEPQEEKNPWKVNFDAREIIVIDPLGQQNKMLWSAVRGIFLETNDGGPMGTEIIWYVASDTYSILFPLEAAGEKEILTQFKKLSGFDESKLSEAMNCKETKIFILWKRS